MNASDEKNDVLEFDNQMNNRDEERLMKTNQNNKKRIIFFSNSPVNDIKSYKEGVDAISEMVDKKDVFNIGIIAPYGAGKSSLIKTFSENTNSSKKYRIAEISLLHLSDCDSSIEQDGEEPEPVKEVAKEEPELKKVSKPHTSAKEPISKYKDAILEKSILEQLFFREEKKKLPASRIERIHSKLPMSILFSIVLVLSCLFSLLTVLQFKEKLPLLDEYVVWPKDVPGHNLNLAILLTLSVIFITVTIAIFALFLKNAKINFQNIEVEFNKIKEGSPFNFFLDEIIYFFKKTKTNIVVFEDIERFGSISLFTKLREINHVLNHNRRIKSKITFIYCVTDDFFVSEEDRAKFFEFVVSLVPVMNTKNGGGYIEECLRKNGIHTLDAIFLKGISHFISDKRVLNDVINDFLYFRSTLTKKTDNGFNYEKTSKSLEDNKLLAMMVYKNLFFSDYVDLLKDKGDLFYLFNQFKQERLKELIKDEKTAFEEVETEIKKVSESAFIAKDMGDLKSLVTGIICKFGNTNAAAPNGFSDIDSVKSFDNLKTGLFVKLQATVNQGYGYYPVGGSTFKSMSIGDLNNHLGKDIALIEKRITGQLLNELTAKKQKIAKEMSDINGKTMKQIVEMIDLNKCDNEFLKNPFITFAISNGYIDETYYLYIGKRSPMINITFVNDVLCNVLSEPSKRLEHCELIIDELDILDANAFQKKSILNYSIVDCLFNSNANFTKQRETFTNFLCSNKDNETKNFVKGYFMSDYPFDNFLISLCKKDKKIVSDLLGYSDISDNDKIELIKTLVKNRAAVDISSLNEDGIITRIVEKDNKPLENFTYLFDDFDSCIEFFDAIELKKFEHLDYNGSNDPVWKETFFHYVDSDCYAINYGNIQTIELYYFEKSEINLSTILKEINPVENYVKSNLDGFVRIVCENSELLHEEQKVIKELLISKEVGNETKQLFINVLEDSVEFDPTFSPIVVVELLKSKKLAKEWNSLSFVYNNVDESKLYIPSFVRDNIDSFSDMLTDKKLCLFLTEQFGEKDYEIVDKLASRCDVKLDVEDFSSDYLCKIFIERSIIEANEANLIKCNNKIESLAALLIKNRTLESCVSKIMFDVNNLVRVLQHSGISDDCKIAILKSNSDTVDKNSSDETLVKYLLDLFKKTKCVCFNSAVAVNIINQFDSTKDSVLREDVIDACLHKYSDRELLDFISAVDSSVISKFVSKKGDSLLKVDKDFINNDIFAKALVANKIVRITRNGPVNKTVDVSKLATLLDNEADKE